jgi:hypothetical protein
MRKAASVLAVALLAGGAIAADSPGVLAAISLKIDTSEETDECRAARRSCKVILFPRLENIAHDEGTG